MTPEALARVRSMLADPTILRPTVENVDRLIVACTELVAALAALTPAPTWCSCACHLRCGTHVMVSDGADHIVGSKEMVTTPQPPPEPEG